MPKIDEIILLTTQADGAIHLAPMGIQTPQEEEVICAPFRPSSSLDNLLRTGQATINYCQDVRIFAGCLTGRRSWPIAYHPQHNTPHLEAALAYSAITLQQEEAQELRTSCRCRIVYTVQKGAFRGFNRAQSAVLEAAVAVSRLQLLTAAEIRHTFALFQPAIDKTAGPHEKQAWQWLQEACQRQGILP